MKVNSNEPRTPELVFDSDKINEASALVPEEPLFLLLEVGKASRLTSVASVLSKKV